MNADKHRYKKHVICPQKTLRTQKGSELIAMLLYCSRSLRYSRIIKPLRTLRTIKTTALICVHLWIIILYGYAQESYTATQMQ